MGNAAKIVIIFNLQATGSILGDGVGVQRRVVYLKPNQ